MKLLLILLTVLLVSYSGICAVRIQELYIMEGEMVVMHCAHHRKHNGGNGEMVWSSNTTQNNVSGDMLTSAEQRYRDMLIHGRTLIIFRVSEDHQGIYTCSLGNSSSLFRVTVYKGYSSEYEENTHYLSLCFTQESCTLYCPGINISTLNIPNITSNGIQWHKEGKSSPTQNHFSSTDKDDSGVYTCTRSYLYHGRSYNMTFKVDLKVHPGEEFGESAILSPNSDDVFYVDLDSTVVIDCKAVIYSEFDGIFWLSGESFVEENSSLPVFYNYTRQNDSKSIIMTASLVFTKVSEEDLLTDYTCKLESDHQASSFVSITLRNKAHLPFLYPALFIVGITVVVILTAVVCAKQKLNIALFLRDTLGCYCSTLDGKIYDVCLMCYKNDSDSGLTEDDRKGLESILKEKFGYNVCLYDPEVPAENSDSNVVPVKGAETVVDCIKQSRTVVLVPSSSDSGLKLEQLEGIREALEEQHTRLVFIKTEKAEDLSTGSLLAVLQSLSKSEDSITWNGKGSMQTCSSFWKHLRYSLPAPPRAQRQDYACNNIL
ncbi:interleukin-1 receptor-like 1 isoform 2-T2 [Pholidichthys leucotaenia]